MKRFKEPEPAGAPKHKSSIGGGWLRLKAGRVTDDTEMAFCIARALDARQGWDLKGIADNFAAWLRTKPVDVGDTCRRSIRNYMLKGMLETPFNQWDAGNGAAMRMAPVSLFTLGDDDLLSDCAVTQARLTAQRLPCRNGRTSGQCIGFICLFPSASF